MAGLIVRILPVDLGLVPPPALFALCSLFAVGASSGSCISACCDAEGSGFPSKLFFLCGIMFSIQHVKLLYHGLASDAVSETSACAAWGSVPVVKPAASCIEESLATVEWYPSNSCSSSRPQLLNVMLLLQVPRVFSSDPKQALACCNTRNTTGRPCYL